MTKGIDKCSMCWGKGYISYTDDDGCDVVPCDCTYKMEVVNGKVQN